MRPREPKDRGQHDLLRSRLDQIIDNNHALAKLSRVIDCGSSRTNLGRSTRRAAGTATLHTADGRAGDPQAHA